MDAVSYSLASKQAQRIEKFIENPDSTSGIVTVPKVIASGETITIPAGRVAILPNVQIDGVLNVEGEVFIPSGATFGGVVEKVTSTDNAIVRFNGTTGAVQNSGVIIEDSGNVGIGISLPKARLDIYTLGISGGLPATTGSAADPNVMARIAASSVCMDIGVGAAGHQWIQCRSIGDYSLNYDLHLQPNGGSVLVTGGGGLGYGTGSGGTVTQLTNKSTAVILNKPTGQIILSNSAINSGLAVFFLFQNSIIETKDTIKVNTVGASYISVGAYSVKAEAISTGQCYIVITNNTGITLSESVQLNFTVTKGANS